MDNIVILGYGGHGKSLTDSIIKTGKYNIVGYTDNKELTGANLTYLGSDDMLEEIKSRGVNNAAIGVGYLGKGRLRDKLYEKLVSLGFELPAIVDPSAVLANDVVLGDGTFVGKGAIINSGAKIGKMCIINSGSLVEHDCEVGDYSHIAVKACLCGEVSVDRHSFIGANATVIQGIDIGSDVIIAAGSTVIETVPDNEVYYGIK